MEMPLELQAARLLLVQRMPYLAAALYAMVPVATPGLETMAVDKRWRLYFDPLVFHRWSKEEVAGVLLHEVNHLLRDHSDRSLGKESERWGIAADAEINDGLIIGDLASIIALPEDSILPGKFGWPDNRLAEEYYVLADQGSNMARHESASKAGKAGRNNRPATQQADQLRGNGQKNTTEPTKHAAASAAANDKQGVELPRPGAGNCGSASDGQERWWEAPETGEGVPPSINRTAAEMIRHNVAIRITESDPGTIPAGLIRWAKGKLRPGTDWRKALGAIVRGSVAAAAGAADYSYSKPSRRQGVVRQGDVLRPALRGVRPRIAVVVDTSASISGKQLAVAVSEIDGILQTSGASDLTVLTADATVESVHRHVQRLQQVETSLIGGGGTDMGKAIQHAARIKPMPDVILVITDGFTPWLDPIRKARVVALLLDSGRKCPDPPGWIKAVHIPV